MFQIILLSLKTQGSSSFMFNSSQIPLGMCTINFLLTFMLVFIIII
ncbi:hypothetical protein YN1HA_5380 [Sulfurisphaera ohwakuensis]